MDDAMLAACGCTNNDTEGLINLPLTAREIQAVVFFKVGPGGEVRVSMRSKYDVDVRRVASEFGGGGHKNAAGFTVAGPLESVRRESSTAHRGRGEGLESDRTGAGSSDGMEAVRFGTDSRSRFGFPEFDRLSFSNWHWLLATSECHDRSLELRV